MLRLSKEKFQNATCTPREIPGGLRERHVPEDQCPEVLCHCPPADGLRRAARSVPVPRGESQVTVRQSRSWCRGRLRPPTLSAVPCRARPVIVEIPHFAALRGKERELVVLRSESGDGWREHLCDCSEGELNEVLNGVDEGAHRRGQGRRAGARPPRAGAAGLRARVARPRQVFRNVPSAWAHFCCYVQETGVQIH